MKFNRDFLKLTDDSRLPEFNSQVAESIYKAKNPANRMYFQKNTIPIWALSHLVIGAVLSFERLHSLIKFPLWLLEFLIMFSCLLQLFIGNRLFRLPVRISISSFLILVFYFWTLIASYSANKDVGRTMADTVDWAGKWVPFYLLIGLSVDQGVYCTPRLRYFFKYAFVILSGLSAGVGILQWLNVGFAQRIAIKNYVYDGAVRATGLSDYPSQLAFQCFIGMVIVVAPVIRRSLTLWEWAGFGYFTIAIIAAQYRTMYFSGIGVAFLAIVLFEFSRNRLNAFAIVMVSIVFIGSLFALFPKRLSYAMTLSKDNLSVQVRQQGYRQLEPIMQLRPASGLGTDSTLFLGPRGKPDKWSYDITDSLYVTITACYGVIGLSLFIITICSMAISGVIRWLSAPPHAQEMAFIGLLLIFSMAILSATGNSLIYRSVGTSIALSLGLGGLTWKEELNVKPLWLTLKDAFEFLRGGQSYKSPALKKG